MTEASSAFGEAFTLLATGDPDLYEIIARSLLISLSAVAISVAIAWPLGALIAIRRFPGRRLLLILINAMMGLPPVVVGLFLYILFSRSGAFGVLNLLYTTELMVIAQVILVTPIVLSLTQQIVSDLYEEYDEMLRSMRANGFQTIVTLIWDARPALITAAMAGLGRALAEVGAVMIVGGNIDHATRVMTTAITLETSRGELALALALGIILLAMSLVLNGMLSFARPDQKDVVHA